MWASAIRSRCPVVTPGFSSLSTRARTSATMRPARRMRSISARDLRVTTSDRTSRATGGLAGDGGEHVLGDLVDRLEAIDDPQQPGIVVVVDDLAEAGELLGQSRPDRVGLVVLALDERRPVDVAATLDLGRIGGLVVDMAGVATHPASRQSADELVGGHLDVDGAVDPRAPLRERARERLRLWAVPRKAVQDDAPGGVRR